MGRYERVRDGLVGGNQRQPSSSPAKDGLVLVSANDGKLPTIRSMMSTK